MTYPYVEIAARDVTQQEGGCVVEIRFTSDGPGAPAVTEQDVVDVVKAFFAQQSNVTATATRYEVTTTTV